MGPAATVDFHAKLVAATQAGRDQDHVRVIIDSNPAVPDRGAAMRGEGPSPGPALAAMARGLQSAGAEVLVMPCNTAHAWADDIRAATPLPFIDLIEATAQAAAEAAPGLKRAGVLGTTGCLDSGLYHRAFAACGAEVLTLEGEAQAALMALIGRVKRGDVGPEVRAETARLAGSLVEAGAEVIVAGCTEVPLVLGEGELSTPVVSSTDVLVARALAFAQGRT
jgi:aspartate racemase